MHFIVFEEMKHFTYRLLTLALIVGLFASCDSFGKKTQSDDIEIIELDIIPMYGSTPEYGSIKKTPEQLESDKIFLFNSDKAQPSRNLACLDYIEFGWFYLNQGDAETAMRRANQAWQLDSTNPDVYVLFAAILNAYATHDEALDMLDRAINISPSRITLYDIYLSESVDLFRQTGDNSNITKLVKMLDKVAATEASDSILLKIESLKNDAQGYLKR